MARVGVGGVDLGQLGLRAGGAGPCGSKHGDLTWWKVTVCLERLTSLECLVRQGDRSQEKLPMKSAAVPS